MSCPKSFTHFEIRRRKDGLSPGNRYRSQRFGRETKNCIIGFAWYFVRERLMTENGKWYLSKQLFGIAGLTCKHGCRACVMFVILVSSRLKGRERRSKTSGNNLRAHLDVRRIAISKLLSSCRRFLFSYWGFHYIRVGNRNIKSSACCLLDNVCGKWTLIGRAYPNPLNQLHRSSNYRK